MQAADALSSAASMTAVFKTFLSYAFRPFFLFNGLFAAGVILLWVSILHGYGPAFLPANPLWHAHEMLVGFAMAAVAGFSLTAVSNWTGRAPVSGLVLMTLVSAWLAGRLVMLLGTLLPVWLAAVGDLVFPVLLGFLLAREIVAGHSRRNYPVAAVVIAMAIVDGLYHLCIDAGDWDLARSSLYLLLHTILLLVVIIGGRIVPNFTANWLRRRGESVLPRSRPGIDRLAIMATVAVGVSASVEPAGGLTGCLALLAALLHGWRLAGWQGFATWREPILLVMHVAYLWLPVGYLLLGASAFGYTAAGMASLHALGMGAIGSMILAVTTRVALGHTGRPLHAARLTTLSYALFTIAVVARIAGPLFPCRGIALIDLAAVGWILSFAIFCWVYWPILTGPRADR